MKRTIVPLTMMLALSACSSPPQPAVAELHNEAGKLNQQVRQLTNQASAIERQSQLNLNSTSGAWLVPAANTPVELLSNAGKIRLSLSHGAQEANGTRAILHLRSADAASLPGMTAKIQWGQLDAASGKPLQAESLSQEIAIPSSLMPQPDAEVPLRLSGVMPQQLIYVRVHDLVVTSPAASAEKQP